MVVVIGPWLSTEGANAVYSNGSIVSPLRPLSSVSPPLAMLGSRCPANASDTQ